MKQHTSGFKENIKLLGKQQDIQIIYNQNEILNSEDINNVSIFYEGSLLKSVMKQLEIDSNVAILEGTELQLKYGLLVDGVYEYLDYGKYIVKKVEKQEDTNSYLITCNDKLLYSMKSYESLGVTYPITVRNYLSALCNKLGLTFASSNQGFVNYHMTIPTELYLDSQGNDIGYTYRDVLDELAQVTASVICINNNDELEVRYINDTEDEIDEEYLKDINVTFGKKYGKINSIVLSRSGESDNIYLRDETSVEENGLCELKIIDNQIMNFNNRDGFLPEILNKLNGIEYYLNDFSSTGICYYDLLDRYTVRIGENTYSCIMLNDEINISQGLEEIIYTDEPEASETDYTKADKTDRRINQTYLIVDKQNQQIEAVINQTTEQNEKINRVVQTVDELNSKISDIADITVSKDSNNGILEFEKINTSEPIRIEIRPIGESISYLYPNARLFPSSSLFLKNRKIRFINKTNETYVDYEIPANLLYYDSENYDEFILDYNSQTCLVNKKVGYNTDGTTYILETPVTLEYEYPKIELEDGDYKVELLGYNIAYMFVRLMSQNIYTDQFAIKTEVSSEIKQTAQEIDLSVNKKLENYSTTTQMNSAINVKANEITSTVSETYETKGNAQTNYSKLTQTANSLQSQVSANDKDISTINQTVNEVNIEVGKKYNTSDFTNAKITAKLNDGTSAVQISADKIDLSATDILNLLAGNTINLTSKNIVISSTNFSLDKNGNMVANNGTFNGGNVNLTDNGLGAYEGKLKVKGGTFTNGLYSEGLVIRKNGSSTNSTSANSIFLHMYDNEPRFSMTSSNAGIFDVSTGGVSIYTKSGAAYNFGYDQCSIIDVPNIYATSSTIYCKSLNQSSLEEKKKNIEKLDNKTALDIVLNTDIYNYNFKDEEDTEKKHIGFVIGDKYKYSKDITSNKNDGVDNYSMTSASYGAIQKLYEIIQEQQKKIEELERITKGE